MTSVGATLRSARENQGRVVAEIAEELCITQRYLRAIEADDIKVLPGIFFYKAFVRQYATLLNLDRKSIESALALLEPQSAPAVVLAPEPARKPLAKAAAAAAGLGRFVDQPATADPSYRPPVRKLDPIVAEGNKEYFSDRRVGVSIAALVGALLLCTVFYAWWNRPHLATIGTSQNAVPVHNVSSTPTSMPTVNVTEKSDGIHVALNLSATESTWLSITSDGKEVFSGILGPSETKTLTGLDVAKMKVGNAGGIEVRWNGKAIGPIGPRGQVRTVMFTPQNFEILEPPAPAPKSDSDPAL
jgi:cytoskeleton protein RodZ